jgi:RimJ/RimL family protein N-acetyltransferase
MRAANRSVATERLRGEAVCQNHYDELARLLSDERVMVTLSSDGLPLSETRIRERLSSHIADWEEHGCGFWMWWEQESNEFVGRGGVRKLDLDGQLEFEIAYALTPDFWNLGFATEIAGFSRDVAFRDIGAESVVGLALVRNSASRWVLEKIGMTYERDCEKAGLPHALYRLRS